MFISQADKGVSMDSAKKAVERLKEYERTHRLQERKIGKCVVKCKNEEQFSEFEKAINNPKIW